MILIKSVMIPGTAAQFNAGMERLYNRLAGQWAAPTGERLYFSKEWPARTSADPCRASWEVGMIGGAQDKLRALTENMRTFPGGYIPANYQRPPTQARAGVEVYEETSGARVDFLDGHINGQPGPLMPEIGAAFAAFAAMICKELGPTPEDDGEKRSGTKPGRPRNTDNEWAYAQVNTQGRKRAEVYSEWKQHIGAKRCSELADTLDSFNKAVKLRGEEKEETE